MNTDPNANLIMPSGFGLPQRHTSGHSFCDYPADCVDAEKLVLIEVDAAFVQHCRQRAEHEVDAEFEGKPRDWHYRQRLSIAERGTVVFARNELFAMRNAALAAMRLARAA